MIRIPTIDGYQRKLFLQSVIFFVLLGTSYDRINFFRIKNVLRNARELLWKEFNETIYKSRFSYQTNKSNYSSEYRALYCQ